MTYVMSDIHGNYEKYSKMLKEIDLKDSDTLYILGDVIDRGDDGIGILLDMMSRPNVFPILGNHEHMAYPVLKNIYSIFSEQNSYIIDIWQTWMLNGGRVTLEAYLDLPDEDKDALIDYLGGEFSAYEEITVGDRSFVLIHGGLPDFSEETPLSDYDLHDIVWHRTDCDKTHFADKFLITGHTPTFHYGEEYRGKIARKNNNIAIDCGVSCGEALGCIRLDDFAEFYV